MLVLVLAVYLTVTVPFEITKTVVTKQNIKFFMGKNLLNLVEMDDDR